MSIYKRRRKWSRKRSDISLLVYSNVWVRVPKYWKMVQRNQYDWLPSLCLLVNKGFFRPLKDGFRDNEILANIINVKETVCLGRSLQLQLCP